jgi:hypothetical protein
MLMYYTRVCLNFSALYGILTTQARPDPVAVYLFVIIPTYIINKF